jgi:hypothetical protein
MKTVLAAFAVAAAAAATALAPFTMPTAHADAADQQFFAVLDSHGVSAKYSDINNAIQSAHMACRELAAGKSEVAVQLDVVGANPNLSRADASWVVYGARKAYCP